MYKVIIIILIVFNIVQIAYSQTQDEQNQLAQQYYKNKEFEKAATIFSDLYNNQKSKIFLTYYLNCLIELKDFESAEKILKKEIRKNSSDLTYHVDLGYVYKSQNLLKEAEVEYQQALKLLQPENSQINSLANAFLSKREFAYAEQTYLKGRKMLKEEYSFNFELAGLYQMLQLYDKMINEYLDVLDINESYLQTVQNRLQSSVYADKENNLNGLLKAQLIKRIQKNPDKKIFSELLIWLYLQDKDYENAFTQSSALDKRLKEDGSRIMELAGQAVINKDYDVALKAYQYVIDKGKYNNWYVDSRSDYMNTLYNKIIEQPGIKKQEVENLEKLLTTSLLELGRSKSTFSLIKAIAFIQAFYLNKADIASAELEKTLNSNQISTTQIAECKLLMGDILLFNNDIWGATVYYAQVEKSNENEPIGHEAKFRKARLDYFSGDFLWAQAQLDVLKASTSKLIANDAFTLSLLISENITADSTGEALKIYSRAEWLIFKHCDSLAILTLDSIIHKYKTNEILDDSYFKLGELYLKKTDYQKAILYFDTVSTKFNFGILSDDALFNAANIFEKYLNNNIKAMEYYQKILTDHPGSILVNEARKRYRFLRGDKLQDEDKPVIINDTKF